MVHEGVSNGQEGVSKWARGPTLKCRVKQDISKGPSIKFKNFINEFIYQSANAFQFSYVFPIFHFFRKTNCSRIGYFFVTVTCWSSPNYTLLKFTPDFCTIVSLLMKLLNHSALTKFKIQS